MSRKDSLFAVTLMEATRLTIDEQWDFVLQQLGDEVLALETEMEQPGDSVSLVSVSKLKPRLKFVLFIEVLLRADENTVEGSLSVDDCVRLSSLATWREPRDLFKLPSKHVDYLRRALKEPTVT